MLIVIHAEYNDANIALYNFNRLLNYFIFCWLKSSLAIDKLLFFYIKYNIIEMSNIIKSNLINLSFLKLIFYF